MFVNNIVMQGEKHLKEFSLALVEIGEGRGAHLYIILKDELLFPIARPKS
jgi:hypothetical protein